MEEDAKRLAQLLKLLANKNRLLILSDLISCELISNGRTVGEISGSLPHISQSALSQHLSLLRAAGILSSDKQGLNVRYEIADHRVIEVIAILKKHYCAVH